MPSARLASTTPALEYDDRHVFEAFGWSSIGEVGDLSPLTELIESIASPGLVEISLQTDLNWAGPVLSIAVCKNHRFEPVIDLFRWLAINAPQAHGLLHVRDQESGDPNAYIAWVLREGELTEHEDPFFPGLD